MSTTGKHYLGLIDRYRDRLPVTPGMRVSSRRENAINDFYFGESDGCIKGERWNVFWYGLEAFDDIRFAVEHCRARPATT